MTFNTGTSEFTLSDPDGYHVMISALAGVPVQGIDLSPAMVANARRLNPGIDFTQGNMLVLDVEDAVWGGIVSFYSLIHVPRADLGPVLRGLKRVLRPGGVLLIAFHSGDDIIHLDEWWEHPVSLDTYFFWADEMQEYLQAAGFTIEEVIERPPYPQVEYLSAMRECMLQLVPTEPPGISAQELYDVLVPALPQEIWPDGEKVGWWQKAVQLDLEAKAILRRDPKSKPLRWWQPGPA